MTTNLFCAQSSVAAMPLGGWLGAYLWTCIVFLGACLGSFANVLVYRLPRNLSVVGPRSFCPACGARVAWHDNIPVLSWLLLRGRCRSCGQPIPRRYPVLEMAGAVCLVLGFLRFGLTAQGLAGGLLLQILLVIAVIDWQHMIIPHTLTIAGAAVGLAASFTGVPGWRSSLLGMLCGAGIILAVSYGYRLIRGRMGMGGGDVMMMGMLGTFVGPWGVPAVLFAGALGGTLYAAVWGGRTDDGPAKLPFGTFLALGGGLIYFWGREILAWYLNIF